MGNFWPWFQSSAPNKPTTLSSDEWRKVNWGKKADIKEELKNLRISNQHVKRLRILLVGPVGSGKSSLIHSIDSVFQDCIKNAALTVGTGNTSFTKILKTYSFKDKGGQRASNTYEMAALQADSDFVQNHESMYSTHKFQDRCGKHLPFVISDVMGLEHENDRGVQPKDLIKALKGQLKDGYKFNPVHACSKEDNGYNRSPTVNDKVHCLVFVLPAHNFFAQGGSMLPEELIRRIQVARKKACDLGIPQVVVLSHVDLACQYVAKNVRSIYKSTAIKAKITTCSNILGIPMNCIFPVKNYDKEIELNDEMDVLLLSALKHILNFANDFAEGMEIN